MDTVFSDYAEATNSDLDEIKRFLSDSFDAILYDVTTGKANIAAALAAKDFVFVSVNWLSIFVFVLLKLSFIDEFVDANWSSISAHEAVQASITDFKDSQDSHHAEVVSVLNLMDADFTALMTDCFNNLTAVSNAFES